MPNPKLIEETTVSLVDVKESLKKIEERDKEMNYRSNKTKEYLDLFAPLPKEKKEELHKKLTGLKLLRLKEAHIVKIIDLIPKTVEDLKIVLQAFSVNIPKKDMESIIAVVKEVV